MDHRARDNGDLAAWRALLTSGCAEAVVEDMTRDDLAGLSWSGNDLHLRSIDEALDRRATGAVDYLVIRTPAGRPVAKAGIDYAKRPDVGVIWQLATHPDLTGRGLATLLVNESERRIRRRGLSRARVDVEPDNWRAHRLYVHLGYREEAREAASWLTRSSSGDETLYKTQVVVLGKPL